MSADRQAMNKQMMQLIGLWARAHGKPRPVTKEGWNLLIAEFMAQHLAPQESVEGSISGSPFHEEVADHHDTYMVDDGATTQIVDKQQEGIWEDDWDRMLRDRARAQIGPNGELLDDFDQEWQLQERDRSALHEEAPFQRTQPPSVVNNPLGNQTNVFDSSTAPNSNLIQVANWIGKSDAETTPVTVTLAQSGVFQALQGVAIAAKAIRPFARVKFGTRGFLASMDVDVGTGVQFTVSGSQVIVEMGTDLGNVGVSAMLSPNRSITHISPIVRTLYIGTLGANATSPNQAVPNFARRLRVERTPAATAFSVQFAALSQASYQTSVAANAEMDWVPISGEIDHITVTDIAGGGTTRYQAIFELCV